MELRSRVTNGKSVVFGVKMDLEPSVVICGQINFLILCHPL